MLLMSNEAPRPVPAAAASTLPSMRNVVPPNKMSEPASVGRRCTLARLKRPAAAVMKEFAR